MMAVDLMHNLQRAGHKVDFNTKEGYGVFIFLIALRGEFDDVKYEQLGGFRKYGVVDECLKLAKDMERLPESGDEVFYISTALKGYNEAWRKQYHILMYRYVSLIAKCDGIISDEEKNWSREIMEMVSEGRGGVRISGGGASEADDVNSDTEGELRALVGLESVKREVESLANLVRVQRRREVNGMKTAKLSYHCVFTGNPGTGKTTVARILAKIYCELGILKKGHLIETDRSGLVGEYVGQTAVKTNKIIDQALDGVLFIDEAYTLANECKVDYGAEAIATLLKRMEDDRNRLIVILAGYTGQMKQFIDSNPGLQSRFSRYIEFPDYSAADLLEIFRRNLMRYEYKLTTNARAKLAKLFEAAVAAKDQNFGNARFARNVFDRAVELQANRLAPIGDLTVAELEQITTADIPELI